METPSQNSVRLHLEKREAFVARNTHKHPPAHTHNQNRRSEVKLGHPTLPSLFRPSLSSFLLRQSVLSSNTTPLVKHTHTYHLDTVQPPTTVHKTLSSIH